MFLRDWAPQEHETLRSALSHSRNFRRDSDEDGGELSHWINGVSQKLCFWISFPYRLVFGRVTSVIHRKSARRLPVKDYTEHKDATHEINHL